MKYDERLVVREYNKNLFPMIFSTLGGTINTLVDSVFVSNVVGENALAAVNLCLPIYLIMCTFGSLFGWGAGALSAREIGRDNIEGARKWYNEALKLCLYVGAIISVLGCILTGPISRMLSQGTDLYDYVSTYAFYSFLAAIPNCILYIAIQYLQLEGKLKAISVFMTIMIGVDIALDYILMVVCNMGVRGAALASLISVMVAGMYGFYKLQTGIGNFRFNSCKLTKKSVREIFVSGSPFASGNCCDVIKTLVLNSLILGFFGTSAMAILAILNSIAEICISITTGVPSAAGPLTGVFYSSRENSSLKSIMKLQLQTGLVLAFGVGVLLIVGNDVVSFVFSTDENLLIPLVCFSIFVVLDMIASIYSNYINKCNHTLLANAIVFIRRLFAPIFSVMIVLLLRIYLWSFYVIMGMLGIGLIIVAERIYRKQSKATGLQLEGVLLLDYSLERSNRVIDFSVDASNEKICEASEQISEFCAGNNMNAKLSMKIQMAIEELLTVYLTKNDELDSIDLRAYALSGNIGIRVRLGGIKYNPFDKDNEEDDDFLMGINMLEKMADVITYTYTLGLNNLSIVFDEESK